VREAVGAITAYAFTTLDLARVQTGVFAWNTASMRVLEANGYVREGVQRDAAFKDGRFVDCVLFAKLRGGS
jgi:ribosomal-protein-alanine N-acetyltransferase